MLQFWGESSVAAAVCCCPTWPQSMVKINPKDSRGSRCLKDLIVPRELSPQSQPQTDDKVLPQTQAAAEPASDRSHEQSPRDVSHSDRQLYLSLAVDASLVHVAEYIDNVFKSLGIKDASQSGACGSGALDAGLSGITAASHSDACGSGALDAGLCVGPEEKREEGPDENAGENAGEDPYDIIHIPFSRLDHTHILLLYIYNC